MFIVVSYDIPDDKGRTRLYKLLLNYGGRVQYSVFECLLDGKHFNELKKRVRKVIDVKEDSVRYYLLCHECKARIEVTQGKPKLEDEKVIVV